MQYPMAAISSSACKTTPPAGGKRLSMVLKTMWRGLWDTRRKTASRMQSAPGHGFISLKESHAHSHYSFSLNDVPRPLLPLPALRPEKGQSTRLHH